MMMTFCKKSVHSFLGGLSISNSCLISPPLPPSSPCNKGLGLITSPNEIHIHRPPNVVESASIVKSPPPPSQPRPKISKRVFMEELGGSGGCKFADGLNSCTESLGFESYDEQRNDDDGRNQEKNNNDSNACSTTARSDGEIGDMSMRWRDRIKERRSKRDAMKVKKFPPPISSLNKNGQPNFFLRPVRKDGRLELTEVRIDRPEVLRASREDGRLRLLLVRDDKIDGDDCIAKNDVCEGNPEDLVAINEEMVSFCAAPAKEEEEEEETEEDESSSEEKETGTNKELCRSNNDGHNLGEEWGYSPMNGEGFRRCYNLLNHHGAGGHYYHGGEMHMWRQHCVTTR
ncbi:unnamed protein product [Linum trigynum]|uniref:FAF domain-containing protein n=1 Tax=Linum trigynum TaxID=586398 RepID=A0AAV2F6M6_9ROSI